MQEQEMTNNLGEAIRQQCSDIVFEQCSRQAYVWHCQQRLSIAAMADRFNKLFTHWALSGGTLYYARYGLVPSSLRSSRLTYPSVRQWRTRTKKWMESWEKSFKHKACWILNPPELEYLPLWDHVTPKGVEYEPCRMVGIRLGALPPSGHLLTS